MKESVLRNIIFVNILYFFNAFYLKSENIYQALYILSTDASVLKKYIKFHNTFKDLEIIINKDKHMTFYDPDYNKIVICSSNAKRSGMLAHEIRHYIQQKLNICPDNYDYDNYFDNVIEIDAMLTTMRFMKWFGINKKQIIYKMLENSMYTVGDVNSSEYNDSKKIYTNLYNLSEVINEEEILS